MENYKKQRKFCADLLRKTKTEFFKNLNQKHPKVFLGKGVL